MDHVRVLGIPVNTLRRAEVIERVSAWISARLPGQIVTINPEFLIAAQHDAAFRKALTGAELSVPDGIGIRAAATYRSLWAPDWQPARLLITLAQGLFIGLAILVGRRILTKPLPETITGVDLIDALAKFGAESGWTFYLAGGVPGRATKAALALQARYPTLQVVGAEDGPPDPRYRNEPFEAYLQPFVERIQRAKPDVLLIAFGAPRQDLFIATHKSELNVPVMMGVGGSFDFIAGAVQRAPQWLRVLGLEWLWRLVVEPWRWRRILTATIVFPWQVFLARQRVHS